MNKLTVGIASAIVFAVGVGFWLGQHTSHQDESTSMTVPTQVNTQSKDRKVLYWYDPMSPMQHFDKPGKSPFMDMQLVPRYQDDADSINVDATLAQKLGIRTAKVERSALSSTWNAQGVIAFNQREVSIVQVRTNGFVSRVYRHAPGDVVQAGDALVDIVVPEWYGAQAEYLALLNSGDQQLSGAARSRLLQMGMSEKLITLLEHTKQVSNTLTINAPRAGMISSLDIREGMTVATGNPIATINGLDTVWLEIAVPESQSAVLSKADAMIAQVAAYPGETFSGKVMAILPDTNVESHTLRVRVEFNNPSRNLKPGMYAQVQLRDSRDKPVTHVPTEAVIRTGIRNVVLVMEGGGNYAPVEVRTGIESNGRTEILSGLNEGQAVVVSGQFLIDSESTLSESLGRMQSTQKSSQSSASEQGGSP